MQVEVKQMNFLIIALMIYFIKEQFEYSELKKLTYYFLPVFSLIQMVSGFEFTGKNILILVMTILIGRIVGGYQTKSTQTKRQLKPVYIYYDENNEERKIFKRGILIKGGKSYILGWFIIFGIQLCIQYFILAQQDTIQNELYKELLSDLFSIYRLQGFSDSSENWYAWSLYGFSSLFYLLILCKKNPAIKESLFNSDKEIVE